MTERGRLAQVLRVTPHQHACKTKSAGPLERQLVRAREYTLVSPRKHVIKRCSISVDRCADYACSRKKHFNCLRHKL